MKLLLAALFTTLSANSAALAQGLQRFDMSKIPLSEINLVGGSFAATLYENTSPFLSQLLIECQNCQRTTDALVGIVQDAQQDGRDFARDPQRFLDELNAVCLAQAESCQFSEATVGGMDGYAYVANFGDGISVVEHVYFSNELQFIVNASGPSVDISKQNVARLTQIAGPYVTGQKP